MTTIYLATGDGLAVARRRGEEWHITLSLEDATTQCVAIDQLRSERVYCGTFGRGLWRSEDAGASWRPAGGGGPPRAAAPGRTESRARSTTRTRWRYTLWRRAACMKRQAGATPRVWTAAPRGDASTAAWSTTISGAWRWTPRIQI